MEPARRLNHTMVQHRIASAANQPQQIGESILSLTGQSRPSSGDPEAGKLYDRAGVPRRHLKKPDDSIAPREWLLTRDKVCGRLGSGFLIALIGTRGTGKTQIAQQAIMAACAGGRATAYVRAMTIFLTLRATYRSETKTELDVINFYRDPRLLVIDECQDRGETPWEDRNLNHLIDLRYGDMTDTLLIANLTPKALKESLGESVSDRLREAGGIIECTWGSFRSKDLTPAPR